MNDGHLLLLASEEWRHYLEVELMPWVLGAADLSGDVLEVGPGPGLMTDLLRVHARRLVAVEIDLQLARALEGRVAGTNVEVMCIDARATDFTTGRFDVATAFTMLHHVPSVEGQDGLFTEMHRVLRPGGLLIGIDSVDSPELRAFHVNDVFIPLDPGTLAARLETAGFVDVVVEKWTAISRHGEKVRFTAVKQ